MASRIYSLKSIKYWYCYTVDEVCRLYAKERLHPQTVRGWIRDGLKVIDSGKPALIYGNDLVQFLGKMNERNKCKTQFDEMFCMGCKDAKPFYQKRIALAQKENRVHAKSICRTCHSAMYKSYKLDDVPAIQRAFHVVHDLALYDSTSSPSQTHIEHSTQHPASEPAQWSLF
jgi:hypothetical protein